MLTTPFSCLDVLPTLAEWTGSKLQEDRLLDGQSVAGMLTDAKYNGTHKPIYYINGTPEVVRDGAWKLRRRKEKEQVTIELFNLSWDPAERVNLADKYPDQLVRLTKLLDAYPGK